MHQILQRPVSSVAYQLQQSKCSVASTTWPSPASPARGEPIRVRVFPRPDAPGSAKGIDRQCQALTKTNLRLPPRELTESGGITEKRRNVGTPQSGRIAQDFGIRVPTQLADDSHDLGQLRGRAGADIEGASLQRRGDHKLGGAEVRAAVEGSASLSKFVRVTGHPTDQVLAWLYRHCLFSAYPSHVEGWGLPIGESAWFGNVCVTSRTSSVPEVCGELMDYVDPADIDEVTRVVRRLIIDRDYLARRKAGIGQAVLRRWSDVANDLWNCLPTATWGAPPPPAGRHGTTSGRVNAGS
jgi:hypothetical protein